METILVVDDERIVLALCQQILRSGGYDVRPMNSAKEALDFFAAEEMPSIALALLDVMMPGMNGIELAARIRKVSPSTKILLMTGYGPAEIRQVIGEDNQFAIIWKPFRTDSLLRMIENTLTGDTTILE